MGMDHVACSNNGSARIDLSNELLYASNRDHMPKLRPREVDVPIYPKRGPQFGVSFPRVRFWNVKGFSIVSQQ